MSDQCRNCSIRGLSIDRCKDTKETACSIPESWYAQAIEEELANYKSADLSIREELQCRINERDRLKAELAASREEVGRLRDLVGRFADKGYALTGEDAKDMVDEAQESLKEAK